MVSVILQEKDGVSAATKLNEWLADAESSTLEQALYCLANRDINEPARAEALEFYRIKINEIRSARRLIFAGTEVTGESAKNNNKAD